MNGIKKIFNKIAKNIVIVSFIIMFSSQLVFAHESATIDFTFSETSFKYVSEVNIENVGRNESHKSDKYGFIHMRNKKLFGVAKPFTSKLDDDNYKYYVNYSNLLGNTNIRPEDSDESYASYWDEELKSFEAAQGTDAYLPTLTFKPYHFSGPIQQFAVSLKDEDTNRAHIIADELTNSLNNAVDFIADSIPPGEVDDPVKLRMYIAEQLANAADAQIRSTTFWIGQYSIYVLPATSPTITDYKNDSKFKNVYNTKFYFEEDIARVQIFGPNIGSNHYNYFPVSIYKGYADPSDYNGYGEGMQISAFSNVAELDEPKITWRHVVLNAHVHYLVFEEGPEDIVTTDGYINKWLLTLLNGMLNSVRSFFDLASSSDLVFGTGREGIYYNNTMPTTWFKSATLIFTISMVLAWIALFSSIIQLSLKKNITAITSTPDRIDLLEGYRNIIIAGLLLFCIIPFFYGISLLSMNLNDVLAKVSPGCSKFGQTETFGQVSFGSIFAMFFFLFFDFYMNFLYIYRALILAILYGISPICVITISLGAEKSKIFLNWLKAILSSILIANIHGVIIAITAPIFLGKPTMIESIGICFALIPISKQIAKVLNLDGFDGHGAALLATGAVSALAGSMKFGKKQGNNTSSTAKEHSKNNDLTSDSTEKTSEGTTGTSQISKATSGDLQKKGSENKDDDIIQSESTLALDNEHKQVSDAELESTVGLASERRQPSEGDLESTVGLANEHRPASDAQRESTLGVANDHSRWDNFKEISKKVAPEVGNALLATAKTLGFAAGAFVGANMLMAEKGFEINNGAGSRLFGYSTNGLANQIRSGTTKALAGIKGAFKEDEEEEVQNTDQTINSNDSGTKDDETIRTKDDETVRTKDDEIDENNKNDEKDFSDTFDNKYKQILDNEDGQEIGKNNFKKQQQGSEKPSTDFEKLIPKKENEKVKEFNFKFKVPKN